MLTYEDDDEEDEEEEVAERDTPDGDADPGTTMRAQRYTFIKFYDQLPTAVRAEYEVLSKETAKEVKGKQAKINVLINSVVSRSNAGVLTVKEQTVNKLTYTTTLRVIRRLEEGAKGVRTS